VQQPQSHPWRRNPRSGPIDTREKMTGRPRNGGRSAPQALRWSSLPARDARRPVTVTLTFTPHAEPWIVVELGGARAWVPPTELVWELVLRLNGWTQNAQ
jgi:hypothetical protein